MREAVRYALYIGAAFAVSGCTTVTKHKAITPPSALLAYCQETKVRMATNGDLPKKIISLRKDLAGCNADKAELRAWSKAMAK